MKRIYLTIGLFILSVISIHAQDIELESVFDYNAPLAIKKTEKLNESPYAIFGDSTAILKTAHETNFNYTLKIPISEDENPVGFLTLDFHTAIITITDLKGDIKLEQQLTGEQLARFLSPDPLAEKYYSWSPYAYCMNNPIRFIDPNGMDVWEINQQGEIINRITDESQDAFYMVDSNGTRMVNDDGDFLSISFEYGTVESQRSLTYSSDGKSVSSFDVYKVRGDDNGTQMFEFMSQNTGVEWSQAKTGVQGDKGLNFLTTSHISNTEPGMTYLFGGQLYAGYTIREMNHNHPNNTAYPSGSFVHPATGSGIGEWGDVGFSRSITNNRQMNKLNIPSFNIYLPGSKTYINYGPNSIRSHYGH